MSEFFDCLSYFYCKVFAIAGYPFGNMYVIRIGMAAALKKIGLELEGTQHRGDDDAYNIARILRYMVETYGIDMLDSFWD